MKANELMVGDLVYSAFSDIPCKVKYLELRESGYGSVKTSNVDGIKDIASLYPIPLTPEILEKNGFLGEGYAILKLDSNSWLEYYYHEHRLRKYWSGIDEWENHSEVKDLTFQCHCHYVHELQHALKLCHIEKTIEL